MSGRVYHFAARISVISITLIISKQSTNLLSRFYLLRQVRFYRGLFSSQTSRQSHLKNLRLRWKPLFILRVSHVGRGYRQPGCLSAGAGKRAFTCPAVEKERKSRRPVAGGRSEYQEISPVQGNQVQCNTSQVQHPSDWTSTGHVSRLKMRLPKLILLIKWSTSPSLPIPGWRVSGTCRRRSLLRERPATH